MEFKNLFSSKEVKTQDLGLYLLTMNFVILEAILYGTHPVFVFSHLQHFVAYSPTLFVKTSDFLVL